MKYTQQPVAVGGLPSHTQQTHTHVCVAYTMMMIVCVLRLFKKEGNSDVDWWRPSLSDTQKTFPFSTISFRLHMEMFGSFICIFIFCAWLYPKLHKKHSKTNTFLSLFSIWIKILVSLFFPHPPNSFFFVWVRLLYSPEMVFDASPVYV